MTTQLIPRPVALLKLVELEPINYDHARIVCGWPAPEFAAIVRQLSEDGRIGWVQGRQGERRTLKVGLSTRSWRRRAAKAMVAA
ncbi:MAG: hypothetical protein EOO27_09210 [Comamonadaceae bacterium]|nr:MAG: hypothetical protein EOO27_09210 [Comamonadaceae bacterium]